MQSWSLDLEDGVALLTYSGPADSVSLLAITELADTLEGLEAEGPTLVVLTRSEMHLHSSHVSKREAYRLRLRSYNPLLHRSSWYLGPAGIKGDSNDFSPGLDSS
jgi:hypothetical protein